MPLKSQLQVMVVDDMSISRALIEQALDWAGIRNVTYAESGDLALKMLNANPAHMVISDYNMPGMDGLTLLELLRGFPATRNIGFILVTGSASKDIIDRGRRAGLNNFITKPFDKEKLLGCIEAVTGKLQ